MESRRKFLTMLLASGVPLAVTGYTVHAQESQTKPPVKPPIKDEDPEEPKIDSKAMLEANQKDIKKNIERLYQLASELKTPDAHEARFASGASAASQVVMPECTMREASPQSEPSSESKTACPIPW